MTDTNDIVEQTLTTDTNDIVEQTLTTDTNDIVERLRRLLDFPSSTTDDRHVMISEYMVRETIDLIEQQQGDITAMGEDMAKETQLVNAYAKTIVELKGLVYEHLTAPDTQKIREWQDLARRSRAALEDKHD